LRQKKCPFIIALNKIDRLYGWKAKEYNNTRDALDSQSSSVVGEFGDRLNKATLAFAEEGFNSIVYWDNQDIEEFVSFVPTSAISGEGLPDLITYLTKQCMTRIPQ
jgi:translation initiation factor 5B